MTVQEHFESRDWERITALPMLVGVAVTAADPSGLWGAIKESAAMASELRRAKANPEDNDLIAAVVAAYDSADERQVVTEILRAEVRNRKPPEIVEDIVAEVERLMLLATVKMPEDAPGFGRWLIEIARQVAEAATEGGFLGFGGEPVSAEERATLDRLALAIRVGRA
ncbi:hypothetical protein CDV50_12345 [Haematobacter massiliensis]|uniref:Uncharacterized protein n=1 Tax=Haematobacter massiliensis TaxID=195105 RepID=A0A086XZG1_9RHOB|nr:hypothetical protein [Haematobacter massiliensis]KFI27411.1 hypothetical protein CN97_01535 [Haematobacter massiliensis]OWJ70830.1 hypothetical protein CDV50_12345 [Haematobacter massiliensis]OWJ84848.1 hypothetical protein CDV51_12555 [Haematobacter massiliensis]QBJ23860.1 hypothetical protein HmaOT1_06085 [Haematobacter massiliensis]